MARQGTGAPRGRVAMGRNGRSKIRASAKAALVLAACWAGREGLTPALELLPMRVVARRPGFVSCCASASAIWPGNIRWKRAGGSVGDVLWARGSARLRASRRLSVLPMCLCVPGTPEHPSHAVVAHWGAGSAAVPTDPELHTRFL